MKIWSMAAPVGVKETTIIITKTRALSQALLSTIIMKTRVLSQALLATIIIIEDQSIAGKQREFITENGGPNGGGKAMALLNREATIVNPF